MGSDDAAVSWSRTVMPRKELESIEDSYARNGALWYFRRQRERACESHGALSNLSGARAAIVAPSEPPEPERALSLDAEGRVAHCPLP